MTTKVNISLDFSGIPSKDEIYSQILALIESDALDFKLADVVYNQPRLGVEL